jgi:hypothetical protein
MNLHHNETLWACTVDFVAEGYLSWLHFQNGSVVFSAFYLMHIMENIYRVKLPECFVPIHLHLVLMYGMYGVVLNPHAF